MHMYTRSCWQYGHILIAGMCFVWHLQRQHVLLLKIYVGHFLAWNSFMSRNSVPQENNNFLNKQCRINVESVAKTMSSVHDMQSGKIPWIQCDCCLWKHSRLINYDLFTFAFGWCVHRTCEHKHRTHAKQNEKIEYNWISMNQCRQWLVYN